VRVGAIFGCGMLMDLPPVSSGDGSAQGSAGPESER